MSDAMLAIRLRALGDVVLTTPALRALRAGHPGRPLDVVTDPRYLPLLVGLPGIRRVWAAERGTGAALTLAAQLRHERYALAVDFFGNPRSALLTAACGARTTAGYDLRGRRYAYRQRVAREVAPAPGRREHASAVHVRLAEAVGGRSDGLAADVALSDAARHEADALLRAAGIDRPEATIGFIAAGTWATKTWPPSHAARCIRRLIAAGFPVLLIAGPGEEAVTESLDALVPGLHVLPRSGVAALVGVIERLRAVVGTDSGPRHIAAALGVPTFCWFGPTHPDTWASPGPAHGYWWTTLPCRGCDRTACPHWNCLPTLSPDTAADAVLAHLERHARSTPALGPAHHA
jgi:ADP-heptose:LPS heptosyltransferase